MEKIEVFLAAIRGALAGSALIREAGGYVDLATAAGPVSPEAAGTADTPPDTLITFQQLVMGEIARCNADKIKIAVNELLRHLLATITPDREHYLAERYLYRVRMIFKRCLMPDFPFSEEIWNYICDCLRSVGSFMVEKGYFTAAREIIDSLAGMGRIAALKGLPTANTQSSLRILENKALEKNEKQLASVAKNARFNLET